MISKKDREIVKNISEEDFKDYMGTNAYKFLEARNRLLEGKILSWSWMPLFGGVWAGYYKWWFGIMQAVLASIAFGWMGFVAIPVIWGFFGRTSIVVSASKKISKIKSYESDPLRLKDALREAGKPSVFTAILGIILPCIALGISFVLVSSLSN